MNITIDAKVMKQGFEQTMIAVDPEDGRAYLKGVSIISDQQVLRFVGSDGRRLAHKSFEIGLPEFNFIVPIAAVKELLKKIKKCKDIGIEVEGRSMKFTTDTGDTVTEAIDAKLPDKWRELLEPEVRSCLCMNRKEMEQAVKATRIMARSRENRDNIQINIQDIGYYTVFTYAATQDVGDVRVDVDINTEFSRNLYDATIGVNSQYLLDFLRSLKSEVIEMEYLDGDSAMVFHNSDPSYRYVLMPVRY